MCCPIADITYVITTSLNRATNYAFKLLYALYTQIPFSLLFPDRIHRLP